MAHNFANQCRDNGREVEKPDLFGTEIVQWRKEDGKCGVDADNPGEGEQVIDTGNEDSGFESDLYRTKESL
jgi:hypothetical protein